ncbi:MAG: hypothetical protein AB8B58_03385 [Roseobacter sp.]
MIFATHKANWNLNYYYGTDPFDLEEIYALQKKQASSGGEQGPLNAPTFYDIRSVDLLVFDSAQLRRLISQRYALGEQHHNNAFAVVVGDEGCYGMMRMYNAYADLIGLRKQANSFVSLDMKEAVEWIAPHLKGAVDARTLQHDLEAESASFAAALP